MLCGHHEEKVDQITTNTLCLCGHLEGKVDQLTTNTLCLCGHHEGKIKPVNHKYIVQCGHHEGKIKPVNHRHVPVCSVDIMRGKLDAEELGIITRTSFMDEFFHEDEIASPSQFILYHYNGLPRSCPHGKVSIEHSTHPSPPQQLHPSSAPLSSPKPHCLPPLNPPPPPNFLRSVCNTALLPTPPPPVPSKMCLHLLP